MSKEILILSGKSSMFNKNNINKLIIEINKLNINKNMKKILLIASLNLLSSVKKTNALKYQLESFKKIKQVFPEKTESKYINKILNEIKELSPSEFSSCIDYLITYVISNKINIKI